MKFSFDDFDFSSFKWSDLFLRGVTFPKLTIGNKTATLPIVQGGMGVGISASRLAAAVAEEGGIGVIAANAIGMLEKDYYKNGIEANMRALRSEIRKARKATDGIIGVNIMVALNDFHNMLQVSIEEKVDIVFLGAGLPLKGIPVEALRAANVAIVPIVSSAKAVQLIFKFWQKKYNDIPDGVVLEGPKAGGHLGYKSEQIDDPAFALEAVLPTIVEAVKPFADELGREIPVIAGGGIFSGSDIQKTLTLGATAVQMGTRFVATTECDADEGFKQTFVNAKQEDVVLIKSPVGMPGRAIRNQFLTDLENGAKKFFKCPYRCLASCKAEESQYCISLALDNARKGKMNHGFAFAGTNAYKIDKIVSVKELIAELKVGYVESCETTFTRIKDEYATAMERFAEVKQEYGVALDTGIEALKLEYDKISEMGAGDYFDDKIQALESVETLKKNYAEAQEYIQELVEQMQLLMDNTVYE